jgi:PadR family transcriptional regulator AphA
MSLFHALLGVLSWHPMTGYELKKHLDDSIQFFWHAELSQIYPTLKQLETKGLVAVESVPQEGKPDKKIYSITVAGREVLIAWLSEPLDDIPPNKNVVLLKLFFSGMLPKADLLAQLHTQLTARRARLKRVQQEAAARLQEGIQIAGVGQESMMWELVRQYGEMQQQTAIRWLEMAIAVVEASDKTNSLEG